MTHVLKNSLLSLAVAFVTVAQTSDANAQVPTEAGVGEVNAILDLTTGEVTIQIGAGLQFFGITGIPFDNAAAAGPLLAIDPIPAFPLGATQGPSTQNDAAGIGVVNVVPLPTGNFSLGNILLPEFRSEDVLGDFRLIFDGPANTNPQNTINAAGNVFVIRSKPPTPGDFDADGDVDGDDVDFYVGSLDQPATGELAQLDLDGDGDVTIEDHNLHVTTLVVTSNGVAGALLGDVNLDGKVDVLNDAFALVGSLGLSVTSRSQGDLNADGLVDVLSDAFLLIGQLGQSNDP